MLALQAASPVSTVQWRPSNSLLWSLDFSLVLVTVYMQFGWLRGWISPLVQSAVNSLSVLQVRARESNMARWLSADWGGDGECRVSALVSPGHGGGRGGGIPDQARGQVRLSKYLQPRSPCGETTSNWKFPKNQVLPSVLVLLYSCNSLIDITNYNVNVMEVNPWSIFAIERNFRKEATNNICYFTKYY